MTVPPAPAPEEAMFYLLACRLCGDPARPLVMPLVMPFGSPADRGGWAAEHTRATGHDKWWVKDYQPDAGPGAEAEGSGAPPS